nr:hypothetical protein [uncultured Aminipila sp.]
MNEINLNSSQIMKIRDSFRSHIENDYPTMKDKNIIISDAFYPLRHNIGIEFWDVFKNDESIKRCQILLEQFFQERNRLNPKRDASTYIGSIKKLKEYIDNSYGGVNKLLNDTALDYDNLKQVEDTENNADAVRTNFDVIVPKPCLKQVDYYLQKWNELENYIVQESALNKLFLNTYPGNTSIDEVLVKVSVLNDFYSTNIFNPYKVAKHIVNLNIDERLYMGDVLLVEDIAKVHMGNKVTKRFYSFASKYCSHHVPQEFPIYDSYIAKMLKHFKKIDKFSSYSKEDLKIYPNFKKILKEFQVYYNLTQYNLKEIDKYLWQLGKEYFPNNINTFKRT